MKSATVILPVPIPLKAGGTAYMSAGATKNLPKNYNLIRCAAEIQTTPGRIAFDLGTRDFTPFDPALLEVFIPPILRAIAGGERLYVGCMGGTGRTGTLLSILVGQHPQFDGDQAIAWVRYHYRGHAVETEAQADQVREFSGTPLPKSHEVFPPVDEVSIKYPLEEEYDVHSSAPLSTLDKFLSKIFG